MAKKFNFAEAREKAVRAADQELEQGLEQIAEQIAEQGGAEQQTADGRSQADGAPRQEESTLLLNGSPAMTDQQIRTVADKAGKSINIELPLSLHTRLKIACAKQNRKLKDIVPEIIAAWVEQVEKQ